MKNTALRILNPFIGLLVLSQAGTALFADKLPHKVFETVHEGGGMLLFTGVTLHVILNFGWIRMNLLKRPGAKA
jgi:hypothetical protein